MITANELFAATNKAIAAKTTKVAPKAKVVAIKETKEAKAAKLAANKKAVDEMFKAAKAAEPKTVAKAAPKAAPKAVASKKAPTKKIEVAAKKKVQGIGAYVNECIEKGKDNAECFAMVQKKFPEAATSMNCIRWYRSKLNAA
jgi:hypothetical protein